MVDQHVAIREALLLQSLVVLRQLCGVLADGDAVACHSADDLQLASLLVLLCVAQTHDADVDEAAGKVGETVGLRSALHLVQLDAQNAAQLAEQEGVGTGSRHTSVQLVGVSLCVLHKAIEVIVGSILGHCQGGEAVVLQAGDEGQVGHGVDLCIAGDVLDVQSGGGDHQGGAIGLCICHGLVTHGVGVVVGNGGLETVDAVQTLTVVTDRQIGAAACLAGNCQRDGLILWEADAVSGSGAGCGCSSAGGGSGAGAGAAAGGQGKGCSSNGAALEHGSSGDLLHC